MYVCIEPWYWLYLAMKNKNDNLPARRTGDSGRGEVTVSGIEGINGWALPGLVVALGADSSEHFLNYFASKIRNHNTRQAYLRAWIRFDAWCKSNGITDLRDVRTLHIGVYIESITLDSKKPAHEQPGRLAKSSVKQHRAALLKCCSFLVEKHVIETNPVTDVAGPKIRVRKGKTPVFTDDEFLTLLDSIPDTNLLGLRDRALISVLAYGWPRISAALGLTLSDYYPKDKRWYIRVNEKGGEEGKEILLHYDAQRALDAYLEAAGLTGDIDRSGPIFRSFNPRKQLQEKRLDRSNAFHMVRRRAKAAGLKRDFCNHSFRATGITNYMTNGGRIDVAKDWAGHADERTTGLYDRSQDKVNEKEVDRMHFKRK